MERPASEANKKAPETPPAPPIPQIKVTATGFVPAPKPTFEPLRMHFAVNSGNLEEAKKQLARGISLEYVTQGYTPLILAIVKEQTDIAILLASGGADVNHAEETKQARLPIHVAAKYGSVQIVEALLDNGASVYSIDNDFMTAIHVACYEGHLDLVKYLVGKGAHINYKDGRGRSPLFNAVGYNHIEVVSYLVSIGAIVNSVDTIGWTPLIESVVCGYIELVRELLAAGANVNFADRIGNSPLHHACARLNNAQQMCLIATNIDYNMRHLSTLTPVAKKAIRHIYSHVYEIAYILLDFGADVNAKNIDNETCLDVAVESEKYQLVELLAGAGGDLNYEDNYVPRGVFTTEHLKDIACRLKEMSVAKPKPLMDLCKYTIRKSLGCNISYKINLLPLPTSLKKHVQIGHAEVL